MSSTILLPHTPTTHPAPHPTPTPRRRRRFLFSLRSAPRSAGLGLRRRRVASAARASGFGRGGRRAGRLSHALPRPPLRADGNHDAVAHARGGEHRVSLRVAPGTASSCAKVTSSPTTAYVPPSTLTPVGTGPPNLRPPGGAGESVATLRRYLRGWEGRGRSAKLRTSLRRIAPNRGDAAREPLHPAHRLRRLEVGRRLGDRLAEQVGEAGGAVLRVVGARVDQRRALLELRVDVEELAELVGLADGDEERAGDAGALRDDASPRRARSPSTAVIRGGAGSTPPPRRRRRSARTARVGRPAASASVSERSDAALTTTSLTSAVFAGATSSQPQSSSSRLAQRSSALGSPVSAIATEVAAERRARRRERERARRRVDDERRCVGGEGDEHLGRRRGFPWRERRVDARAETSSSRCSASAPRAPSPPPAARGGERAARRAGLLPADSAARARRGVRRLSAIAASTSVDAIAAALLQAEAPPAPMPQPAWCRPAQAREQRHTPSGAARARGHVARGGSADGVAPPP